MRIAYPVKNSITRYACSASLKYISTLFCLLLTVLSRAQLCQGSLGDPIVNITFGAGFNPGAPLSAAATGYRYLLADCPDDGFYTVRNSTSNCFNNTWHSLSADHTGNANGYFMLVNASFQPSAFYIDTVKGLCGSTTYEFAAWVLNIIKPTACMGSPKNPDLTFAIEKTDGTVLQAYNTGTIASSPFPNWRQQGFFFTTPAGVSDIVLRIVNNAPGGCGNDLALDDITFRPCGPKVVPTIVGETSTTINFCVGTGRTFDFTSTVSDFFINPAYQWQRRFNGGPWTDIAGATTRNYMQPFAATANAGTYEYRLSVADAGNVASLQCRVNSLPLTININAIPVATASSNTPVCIGRNLNLRATGGTQYRWTGPNGFASLIDTPTINNVNPIQDGTYTVIVSNAGGCADTASITISVKPSPTAAVTFTDTTICLGATVQLSSVGGTSYQWLPPAGLSVTNIANPSASPKASIKYQVLIGNSFGCVDTAIINITVIAPAIASAGPDKVTVAGIPVVLEGSIQGQQLRYFWSPASAFINSQTLQPTVMPGANAVYILIAESPNGCGTSSDTVMVKVYKAIDVPNAFTPNGDGLNDTWSIPTLNAFPQFDLIVCNRLGQVVFTNRNTPKPWDGKFKGELLSGGAYVYSIVIKGITTLKGTVLLLR